ncbi:hypothetical protein XACM_4066 [Xanthomonas euvesicatoria pv. citrumelo F1]|nr:hypothetical protein XACM_4066 [Xanthomonas euvesicatoria pv. citrumelo F1]
MEFTQSRTSALQAPHPGRAALRCGCIGMRVASCRAAQDLGGLHCPPPCRALASQIAQTCPRGLGAYLRLVCGHRRGARGHSHMPARLSHTATIAALGETMVAQDVTCAGLRSVYRAAGLAGRLDVSANTTYCLSTLNRTMYPKHFVAQWRLA